MRENTLKSNTVVQGGCDSVTGSGVDPAGSASLQGVVEFDDNKTSS